ncbi:CobW family GTP-binding protein [Prescottella equi]|uniref:Cobalamin biosynthesis protein n=1 Tax=Rhodococcus hoagii TaxID=43767 RepID=A0AAE2WA79_RHOHA|nr:GTP-binding protein [Prescottella equi]MCD7051239.1 GTP-binding protein [Rhodococcus sp. BH2-1]GBF13011.1 putative metal chaperone YciC [Rhodococcus sp. Br-6]MBM4475205.1 GTP-binding protein [Prescottella equi]MBM4477339.1 GTP-binding protein [Prescottella equi]MBM4477342.1 GTP-binding protein [Prescottella equi]
MAKKRAPRSIPVVIVAGFLGSGKTTLLNHLLHNNGGTRIGVIVNDFGSVNVDAMMVAGQVDSMMALSNGCLCCAVDVSDMDEMLNRLAHRRSEIDVIVVEASGLAEPRNMIRLVLGSENPYITYGGLVMLVDGAEYQSSRQRHPELDQHVAIADLVVLNKTDRIDADAHDALLADVCRINPRAAVLSTVQGRVDPGLLFDRTPRPTARPGQQLSFDDLLLGLDEPSEQCGECGGDHDPHIHAMYDSVTFTSDLPMHPRRLIRFLEKQPAGVYRIKGFVYFGVPGYQQKYLLQVVGDHIRFTPQRWVAGEGRRTELVVIGMDLDPDAVDALLDACVEPEADYLESDTMMGVHRYTVEV